jgi:hypothetical protein
MRLSQAVDRVLTALEERLEDEDAFNAGLLRGMVGQLIRQFGDVELNIEVRRVPLEEVVDVKAEEKEHG